MPETDGFVPGLRLSELFFSEVVRSILRTQFPTLPYSAALIGYGSDVLGFDTPMSTDHNWGPRMQLFLAPDDHARRAAELNEALRWSLPQRFRGYAVGFAEPDWVDGGTQRMAEHASGPVNHLIQIEQIARYFAQHLGIDPTRALAPIDWLTFSEQKLLELTRGAVHHDGLGVLIPLRQKLAWYSDDVWRYRIAAQWKRIAQEEAFMGRCGDVGDELGSRIVAGRIVRDLIKLAFLLERHYAPYSKWLGTALVRWLNSGPQLTELFGQVMNAGHWQARQELLCAAYVRLAEMHNALGISTRVVPTITDYFDRPFRVISADRFVEATRAAITDEVLRKLPADIGAVDQFVDCTDVSSNPAISRRLMAIFGEPQ